MSLSLQYKRIQKVLTEFQVAYILAQLFVE